jgi:replicative DNA helicase Mcm
MTPQDRSSMHEAMEQQRISIAKAGITATLQSRCSILGAANPKFGRFHTRDPMTQQINIPPTLLSRFDIIFVITDVPDSSKDILIADHILKSHLVGGAEKYKEETGESVISEEDMKSRDETIDRDIFRKYIAYSKKNTNPVLSEEATDVLKIFYVDVRKQGELEDAPVPITARQLEALVRLAEASARMRLSNEVTKDDANRATRLMEYYLRKVTGEEGRFDIDIIESGIAKSQRERIIIVREIIKRLGEGGETVDREDILEEAEVQGVERSRTASIIDKLNKEEGFIYTPNSKPGKYRLA